MFITLIDKATIKFKVPLEKTQLHQILKKLSREKGFSIRYTISEKFIEDPRPERDIGRSYEKSGGTISP